MALLLKNNLVYLHIPKTGGNWMTKILTESGAVLAPFENKHASYDLVAGYMRRQQNRLNLNGDNIHYCAVVRNPLKWYESWFKYQTSKKFRAWGTNGKAKHWHIMSPINMEPMTDFNAFMQRINALHPGFAGFLFNAYVSNSNAIVLKNENIREDLASLNEKFDLGIEPSQIFESSEYGVSPNIGIEWDPEILAQTIKFEAATFEKYGYSPEDVVKIKHQNAKPKSHIAAHSPI